MKDLVEKNRTGATSGKRNKLPSHLEKDLINDLHAASERGENAYHFCTDKYGVSRGQIWRLAMRHQARITEEKLKQKASERRQEQLAFAKAVRNSVETATVLAYLDSMPDESVDLYLTSPPYNQGKAYESRQRLHYFLGWMLQVLSEMERTLKPGGYMFVQVGSTKDDRGVNYPLDQLLAGYLRAMPGLEYQNTIRWLIPHGLTPEERLAERHESVLVFSKGRPQCFNANAARKPQKNPAKRAYKGPNKGQLSGNPLGAHPTDVWDDLPTVRHNHPERTGHPAQFPAGLARRAILLYTMPGDFVVDPFMGSGTVAEAAIATGRDFSGCDIMFEDIRAKRLAKVCPDLASELPGVTKGSLAIWEAEAVARRYEAGAGLGEVKHAQQ